MLVQSRKGWFILLDYSENFTNVAPLRVKNVVLVLIIMQAYIRLASVATIYVSAGDLPCCK